MKALLLTGLLLSLAGNIALLSLTPKATPAPTLAQTSTVAAIPKSVKEPSPAATNSAATGISSGLQPVRWHQPSSAADLPRLAADLRAAGFPDYLVRLAVRGAHFQLNRHRDPLETTPYWEAYSPTVQIASNDYRREVDAELDALVGTNTDYAASLDPMQRQRRYGTLSDEKINTLRVAEREYDSLRSELQLQSRSEGFTPETYAALQAAESVLLKDHLATLASTLTPDELLAYQLRHAPEARRVSGLVSEIDLNEAEFAQLYQIQTALNAASPQTRVGTISRDEMTARRAALKDRNDAALTVLGEDRFYTYLAAADISFRRLTTISAEHPNFTPEVAYQVVQLREEAAEKIAALSQQRPANLSAVNAAQAEFVSRFETLVGPAADAVRKQSGFSILTPRSAQSPRN